MRLSEVAKATGVGRLVRSTPDTPWWVAKPAAAKPKADAFAGLRASRAAGIATRQRAATAQAVRGREAKKVNTGFAGASGTKSWVTARNNAADSWQR